MNDEEFVKVLREAVKGDMNAVYKIISEYQNLIVANSIIDGVLDEDCKAIIETRIIENINKFKNI